MEEDDLLLSSQLAFSDEPAGDETAPVPSTPAKRLGNDIEKHGTASVSLQQKTTKRLRSQSSGHKKKHRNQDVHVHRSPALSKVSSYRRNPETSLVLPEPISFFLLDEYSLDPSINCSPRPNASKSCTNEGDNSTENLNSSAAPTLYTACLNSQGPHRAIQTPDIMSAKSVLKPTSTQIPQLRKSAAIDSMSSIVLKIDEIPSPPVFTSDEDEIRPLVDKLESAPASKIPEAEEQYVVKREFQAVADGLAQCTDDGSDSNRKPIRFVEDTGAPPPNSRNSSYFSFSRFPSTTVGISAEREPSTLHEQETPHESVEVKSGKKYYLRAFDYVVREVLTRYQHVLSEDECRIVTLIKNGISLDAKALFVRMYRRKQPQWYRVAALEDSYNSEFDVPAAVEELCRKRILVSSEYVAKGSEIAACVLARDVLTTLNVDEIKKLCGCLVDCKKLKRLPRKKLIPALKNMLLSSHGGKKSRGRAQQMTLTGLTPAQIFTRAVLKKAGHSVRIPDHVLSSLENVHFLFFLEEGHDSPNVILADTGKTKFPDYECHIKSKIFPSRRAFEEYRMAISLEQQLDQKLAEKSYVEAANLGSIAELEVREFFEAPHRKDYNPLFARESTRSDELRSYWASLLGRGGSRLSATRREQEKVQILHQLRHPFFRRYTAQWVYVRACYHSVHAFECLREYESAVELLRLLLSTSLVPKRRGKCLNRITINLFKHLGKPQDALDIILSSLSPKKQRLHLGDRLGLAKRGAAIHKKLVTTYRTRKPIKEPIEEGLSNVYDNHNTDSDTHSELPDTIANTLNESNAKIRVRKIYGKSLNVQIKESEAQKNRESNVSFAPWHHNTLEYSRESSLSASSRNLSLNSRAVFSSFRKNGGELSVEEYCMEWYLAKEGWSGIHDEGGSTRFLFSLFMWESALFASVPDVFHTPFQDKPLDLFTEAFYDLRSEVIENRLQEISIMSPSDIFSETEVRYERYNGTRAIGCDWNSYTAANLSTIGAGLGGSVLSHCFRLFCQDYSYWGGGLPDLTLWKSCPGDTAAFRAMLVEVKSARDNLSERQKAWLLEVQRAGAPCEVCKVVERRTTANAAQLEETRLDSVCIDALNASSVEQLKEQS